MCSDAKTSSIALYIKGDDNHSISVNLYGKYHCKLASIWFYLDDINHQKIIQLVSPQFRLQYLSGNATFDAKRPKTSFSASIISHSFLMVALLAETVL